MSKADEIFEELEEAIKEFEKLVKLRKNKCGEITHDTCIVSTAQLETVLNHIENSISKEELKKEITDKMKNLYIDTCAEDSGKYTAYKSILNLLEGK